MAIFILILKIIGIILSIIAGIIVFIIASPITYKTQVDYHGKLNVKARAGFLLGLIRANILYSQGGEPHILVKILFFTIFDNQKPKDKDTNKKLSQNKKLRTRRRKKAVPGEVKISSAKKLERPESKSDTSRAKVKKARIKKEEKKGVFSKIKSSLASIKEKIKSIAVWLDEDHRRLYGFLIDNIVKIIGKIKPKKFSFKGAGGTGDPYWTGRILSAASVIIGVFGISGIEFTPDFEHKHFEADMKASGYFFILPIAIIAFKIYRNKDFKRIILKKDLPVEE